MPNQVETSRVLNLLRGGARGLTADVMGGPVDLATAVANLGVAGYGYGAHKLGLIDSPPDLIDPKTVPGSSDWFAKGTPLEEQEGEGKGYNEARMATGILPALLRGGGVGKTPVRESAPLSGSPEAQRGAVYLDRKGNPVGEDIAVTHGTYGLKGGHWGLNTPYMKDDVPDANMDFMMPPAKSELTHVSFAGTSPLQAENLQGSGYGPNVLVPHPHAIDPKRATVGLYAEDAGTHGGVGIYENLREKASERLAGKLKQSYLDDAYVEKHRYQTLPSWLKSKDLERLRVPHDFAIGEHNDELSQLQSQLVENLRLRNRKDPDIPIRLIQQELMDPKKWQGLESEYGAIDRQHAASIAKALRSIEAKKQLKPGYYAEAKRYGAMPLNKENVAAYIADKEDPEEIEYATKLFKPRGVPVTSSSQFSNPEDMHAYIRDVQTQALRRGR